MKKLNPLFIIALIMLVAFIVMNFMLYPRLPERYPVHFGSSGLPDGWADKSFLSWFALTIIDGLLLSLFFGITKFIRRNPKLINISNKEIFLAMSQENREPVFRSMDNLLGSIAIIEQFLFGYLQYSTFQAAVNDNHMLPSSFGLVLIANSVATFGVVIFFLIRITSQTKRQKRF